MSISVHSAAQNSRILLYFTQLNNQLMRPLPIDQLSLLRSLISENSHSVNAVDAVGV